MSYGSEIVFGGADNVLEWDKQQCIFKFEKKVFMNDPTLQSSLLRISYKLSLKQYFHLFLQQVSILTINRYHSNNPSTLQYNTVL